MSDERRSTGDITLRLAETADDYDAFATIIRAYLDSLGFVVDFQDVDVELSELPTRYGEAGGGATVLAFDGAQAVGGVAVHDYGDSCCEMKRMYILPPWQGRGIGRRLAVEAIAQARRLGYMSMKLDTLARMQAATQIYESLGFRRIEAYRHNPIEDALYFELDLTR
jgi:GNAT superfamily N-acetyltransferase